LSDQEDISLDWAETQPGYAHGLPPFIRGTKHKLLSRGGAPIWAKPRAKLNDADIYFLENLHARYGSEPFKRGDLDAGRINRLLGREMVFATDNDDPLSPETMLCIQVSPRDASTDSREGRRYRYGTKPTWEIVLDAVRSFGRPVSATEVSNRIAADIPDFARTNVGPDLSVLSVNCPSRGHYSMNRTPRKTNSGNPYDQLIRTGSGRSVLFSIYDPNFHGIWELVDVGGKVLGVRFVNTADSAELDIAREAAVANELFAPGMDARNRIMAAIVQREGQPAFRQALLRAYRGACAISGCRLEALLEAAHIVPYLGSHTNIVENGLLLRADLHKLFDLHLFCIDPDTRTVQLSDELRDSEYACFDNVRLRDPLGSQTAPLTEALKHHHERCGWVNAGLDRALPEEGHS
jgi:hypothetical protein